MWPPAGYLENAPINQDYLAIDLAPPYLFIYYIALLVSSPTIIFSPLVIILLSPILKTYSRTWSATPKPGLSIV